MDIEFPWIGLRSRKDEREVGLSFEGTAGVWVNKNSRKK